MHVMCSMGQTRTLTQPLWQKEACATLREDNGELDKHVELVASSSSLTGNSPPSAAPPPRHERGYRDNHEKQKNVVLLRVTSVCDYRQKNHGPTKSLYQKKKKPPV